jgi:hypothetical protein
MFKKSFCVLLLLWIGFSTTSARAGDLSKDDQKQLALVEDSLVSVADSMYNAFIPDERPAYCQKFVKQLLRALKTENSYAYGFEKLGKTINIIGPTDKSFRIFNWLVASSAHDIRYYGAIQMPGEELKLYPLIDCTKDLGKFAEDSILTNSRWFGALYYRIVTTEVNGQKMYTLFGRNSSSPISNKKVMDPLQFRDDGLVFGAPIFNVSSQNSEQRINRFIIEYKKEVQASLNFDDEKQMVYFDKLISQVNDPNRKYTYVPSGEYDGFRWENNQWNYMQDLIPVQKFKDGEAPAPVPLKGKD